MLKKVCLVVMTAAILAGCGKSDSGSSGSSSSGGGSSAKTPEDLYKTMKAALSSGEGEKMYDLLSSASKKTMVDGMKQMQEAIKGAPDDALAEQAKQFGVSVSELKTGDPEKLAKGFFISMSKDPKEQEKAKKGEWVKADIQGDKAICETKDHEGKQDWAVLVKENGEWRFDVEETEKLDKEKGSK